MLTAKFRENWTTQKFPVLRYSVYYRPNKGDCDYKDGEIKYVKNGMNPEKGFIQVHYLKVCTHANNQPYFWD